MVTENHQLDSELTPHDSSQSSLSVRAIAQIEEQAVRSRLTPIQLIMVQSAQNPKALPTADPLEHRLIVTWQWDNV